jgi:hypothetical protein
MDTATPAAAAIERKLGMARDLINALDRTLKMRKLYAPEHPQSIQATNDLVARFLEFFKHYGYLRIGVTSKEFRFEKHSIYTAPTPEAGAPFKLYKDGIREVRFNRGLSREELLEFLSILDMEPQEIIDLNEDIVSLLWRCSFQSIDYIIVDELDPHAKSDEGSGEVGAGGDPGREKLIRELKELVAGYLRMRELVPVTMEVPEGLGQNLPARTSIDPESVPEVVQLLQRPPEETAKHIREFIESEHLGSNMSRAIDALLDMLQLGSELDVKHVVPFLQTAVGHYLARRDYSAIGHLLLRVNFQALLPRIPDLNEVVRRLEGEVKSPSLSQNLVTYLNRGFRGDLEGLRSLFNVIGASSTKVLCLVYPQVLSAKTRALLKEFILKHCKSDLEALRALLRVPDALVFEVFDILGEAKPAWAAKEVESFLKHPSPPIRLRAISLLGKLEGLARTQLLLRLVKEGDETTRLHALRTLEEAKDQATLMFIREWIEDKEFLNRSPAEKSTTLGAYAYIGGEAVIGYLRSLAEKKLPLLGKDKVREVREAAILGLARINSPAAQEALRQMREKGDDHLKTFIESLARPTPKK